MRIALKVGSDYHWLAGNPAVSAREHSWAADFEMGPEVQTQIAQRVRATHARPYDRGNLLNSITFSTTREFDTPAEAELWCKDYDRTYPREGTLVLESITPAGAVVRRNMANAIVAPPRRRVRGASVLLDYSVIGGEITPSTDASYPAEISITGTLTSDGSTTVTFPAMLYANEANGRPGYSNGGVTSGATHTLYWDSTGSAWVLLQVSPAAFWISTSDVASPDLATGWTPGGSATGTPTLTAV